MRIITLLVVVATLMSTCIRHQEMPVDEIAALFAEIRSDTVWISHLDSLASIAIGPGARCLDPVSHSFLYDDRIWLYNQDWGGVLELPSDYIIEDDPLQAELYFHGTCAFSPDSMAIVSFYAGF